MSRGAFLNLIVGIVSFTVFGYDIGREVGWREGSLDQLEKSSELVEICKESQQMCEDWERLCEEIIEARTASHVEAHQTVEAHRPAIAEKLIYRRKQPEWDPGNNIPIIVPPGSLAPPVLGPSHVFPVDDNPAFEVPPLGVNGPE